jgi:hypothetical protein
VIDSKVERSLLGVIFVTNGETYETIEEIPTEGEPGIRYYLYEQEFGSSSRQSNAGMFESTYDITKIGNHYEYTFEMNIYFDRLKIKHDAQIGLVYSDGIDYVETFDTGYNTNRTYTGEVDYMPDFPFYSVHSTNVTYKLNFYQVSSFHSIEVYEYDVNHQLIKTTIMDNYDLFSYTADDKAIFSYVKVISEKPIMLGSYYSSEVHQLLLGEKIEIYNSDDFGLVHKDKFAYIINPLYW